MLRQRAESELARAISPLRGVLASMMHEIGEAFAHHAGIKTLTAQVTALNQRLKDDEFGLEPGELAQLRREGIDPAYVDRARAFACTNQEINPDDALHDSFYWKGQTLFEHCAAPEISRLLITSSTLSLASPCDTVRVLPGARTALFVPVVGTPYELSLEALPFAIGRYRQMVIADERLAGYLLLRQRLIRMCLDRCDGEVVLMLPVDAASLGSEEAALAPDELRFSDGMARRRLHAAGLFEVELSATWPRMELSAPRRSRVRRDTQSFAFAPGQMSRSGSGTKLVEGSLLAIYVGRKMGRDIL